MNRSFTERLKLYTGSPLPIVASRAGSKAMESGHSSNGSSRNPSPAPTGNLTETELQTLHERAAQARAVAAEALAHYKVLLDQTQQRVKMSEQRLLAFEAMREMLRQSVQRYAQVMKALDTPSDRTLCFVRETLTEQLPDSERAEATKDLVESVLAWCVEAYQFDSPAA